ncbi:hypothetical protein V7O62_07720 [Methanolobus sp. ZRKC2]|uniref:hypothetical protein n=1 Tax=Methanolobus sp. ZRKC2 TaxID=3125783 RepID=UPI00324D2AA1
MHIEFINVADITDDYKEAFIKNYRNFNDIWDKIAISDYRQVNNPKNLETKCYFGRGSYPSRINSWQVKTNSLLYDKFIFDVNTFRELVIGFPLDNLENDEDILKYMYPIDLNASSFLIDLYKKGHVEIVSTVDIWISEFDSEEYQTLKERGNLYTDKEEIDSISRKAALFPDDESNYPGLLNMMSQDIMASYLMDSSIITQEYSYYIERKLDDFKRIDSKHNIIDQLLNYEVPNFDSLDFKEISAIRNLRSLPHLRSKIEEASLNIDNDDYNIQEAVQNLRDELWNLALDNIEDNKYKVIVESVISNLPLVGSLISGKNLIKVEQLHKHWGYTILNMRKRTK